MSAAIAVRIRRTSRFCCIWCAHRASRAFCEFDQNRAGRAELLATSFETFEFKIRDQLARTLKEGGFDAANDITAITVNRWPHGYAPEYNPLFDEELPEAEQPHVIGRAPFGRIVIANSDSGRAAYTDSAIDQAHRAVGELLGARQPDSGAKKPAASS